MDSSAYFDHKVAQLSRLREIEDLDRLKAGLYIAQLERTYGAGVVEKAALDANCSTSSLYERQAVFMLVWRWRGIRAGMVFKDFPYLTYGHLRIALPHPRSSWEFEDAIEALLTAGDGEAREEWSQELVEFMQRATIPMPPDLFTVYVALRKGKQVKPLPLFKTSGVVWQVAIQVWNELKKMDSNRRVRVVIEEALFDGQ